MTRFPGRSDHAVDFHHLPVRLPVLLAILLLYPFMLCKRSNVKAKTYSRVIKGKIAYSVTFSLSHRGFSRASEMSKLNALQRRKLINFCCLHANIQSVKKILKFNILLPQIRN